MHNICIMYIYLLYMDSCLLCEFLWNRPQKLTEPYILVHALLMLIYFIIFSMCFREFFFCNYELNSRMCICWIHVVFSNFFYSSHSHFSFNTADPIVLIYESLWLGDPVSEMNWMDCMERRASRQTVPLLQFQDLRHRPWEFLVSSGHTHEHRDITASVLLKHPRSNGRLHLSMEMPLVLEFSSLESCIT